MILRTTRRLFSTSLWGCEALKTRSLAEAAAARDAITKMLSTPSWSVRSLLPTEASKLAALTITSEKLHHILRLSALPPPATAEEESKLLQDLQDQLHFVNAIQAVDTEGVKPLTAIRDENIEERGITLADIERAEKEADELEAKEEEWDVLGNAKRKIGRFFVVEGEMGEQESVDEIVVPMEEVRKVENEGLKDEERVMR